MVLGWTWVMNSANVNNFRWGYTRQSVGVVGNSNQPWIIFRELNDSNGSPNYFRSHNFQMPVNNFVDDFSSTHGRHTLQFGTNIAFIRNPRQSQLGLLQRRRHQRRLGGHRRTVEQPNQPVESGERRISRASIRRSPTRSISP